MTAFYELRKNPTAGTEAEETLLHPRFSAKGTVATRELCRRAAEETTFNAHELEGALEILLKTAVQCMGEGLSVELGSLGTLTPSLSAAPAADPRKVRSTNIRVTHLTLRTSKEMKQRIAAIPLERRPGAWASAPLDEAERDRLLDAHFQAHALLTRQQYQEMRECKTRTAQRELHELVQAGKLRRAGYANKGLYERVETEGEEP